MYLSLHRILTLLATWSKKLHKGHNFLKQLKRASLSSNHLFTTTAQLSSVVFLCGPYQGTNWTDRTIQKSHSHYFFFSGHAVHVYINCSKPNYSGLSQRVISIKFFLHVSEPTSCLHHLLPDLREPLITSKL